MCARTHTVRRSEKRADQFPSRPSFFLPIPIDIRGELARPAAKREMSRDGLIEPPGKVLHFISRRGSRSRIFIAHRAERASFLSYVPHFYDGARGGPLTQTHNHTHTCAQFFFYFPLVLPLPFFLPLPSRSFLPHACLFLNVKEHLR